MPCSGSAAATSSDTPSGTTQRLRLPDRHQLGVRAGRRRPRDAVADGDLGDVGADRDDLARALGSHDVRERHRVRAGAAVGVDEVDARGGDADEDLVGGRLGVGEVDELEDVGTARGGGLDSAHVGGNASARRHHSREWRSYLRACPCMFMHMTFTVAVAGASGYAGGEMLRVLLAHPEARIGDPHRALQRRHARSARTSRTCARWRTACSSPRASTPSPATTSSCSRCRTARAARSPPSWRRPGDDAVVVDLGADHRLVDAGRLGGVLRQRARGHLAVRPARAAAPGGAGRRGSARRCSPARAGSRCRAATSPPCRSGCSRASPRA